jgi:hypothetical protein
MGIRMSRCLSGRAGPGQAIVHTLRGVWLAEYVSLEELPTNMPPGPRAQLRQGRATWIRQQRQYRAWTVLEMARQLRRAAAGGGDDLPGDRSLQHYIHRWESGAGSLSERYQIHYSRAFGITPDQFGVAPLPERAAAGRVDGQHADPVLQAEPMAQRGRVAADGDEPAQHGNEGPAAGSLSMRPRQPVVAASAERSQELGEWASGSEVATAAVEQAASQVQRLARDYVHAPPFPLLAETEQLRDRIARWARSHLRPDQARDIYLLAAQVCGLLAWMTGDLGNYRVADTHAWAAWTCAGQAGHDTVKAWIRATQARLAFWAGRYSNSVQLAQDGLRYDCADSGRVFLALFRARSLAGLGRPDDARRALRRAAAEQGKVVAPDLVGGVWGLTDGRYHALAASTHILRADPVKALDEADRAIALSARGAPADQQNYGAEMHARIDQALALLMQSDLPGAAAALRPVLDLPPADRYDPVARHLDAARRLLTQPAFASAEQAAGLVTEIEAFTCL